MLRQKYSYGKYIEIRTNPKSTPPQIKKKKLKLAICQEQVKAKFPAENAYI